MSQITLEDHTEKVLVLGTAHISEEDSILLSALSEDSESSSSLMFQVREYPNKWVLAGLNGFAGDNVSECIAELQDQHFTPEFIRILWWASVMNFTLVVFDQDGDLHPNLPSFDW